MACQLVLTKGRSKENSGTSNFLFVYPRHLRQEPLSLHTGEVCHIKSPFSHFSVNGGTGLPHQTIPW